MGLRTAIIENWSNQHCDALIALHAVRSAPSIVAFRNGFPGRPLLVALTGTDIYGDSQSLATSLRMVERCDAAIALTETMRMRLPKRIRSKTHVIVQSAEPPSGRFPKSILNFEVCVVGHLRPVKDPLLVAKAVRRLPSESKIRVALYGGSMNDDLAEEVRYEGDMNPRFRWLGDRPHSETLRAIARSHLLVLPSRAEGGPAVISEALACGTPILATRIDASIGLLGNEYPGLFPVGDDVALAKLLRRCEIDSTFFRELKAWCRRLKPTVSPAQERRAWGLLLATLDF